MRLAVRRNFGIGSVNKQGGGWRQLSGTPANIDLDPHWSPDGVWVTYRAWGTGIYRANASELNPTPVNLTAGTPYQPIDHAWSPDSSQIAYVMGAGVWVMDLSGNNKMQLTLGAQTVSAPAWSPDGTQIAYITTAGLSAWPNLWVMNADGTDAHAVTNGSYEEFEPAWFPSGDRLLFGRTTSTGRDLFAVNADGTGSVNLTPADGDDYQAEISPDGEYIAWASNRYEGNYEIYTMRPDGTEVERVTHTKTWATDSDPTWRICN
jgi:TolB protein